MKQIHFSFFIFLLVATVSTQAQVGIGTSTPAASAQLDISSTSKGLLPPRMTLEQRDFIVAPVAGLLIWCTNCGTSGEIQFYNGTYWTNMAGKTVTVCNQVWMEKNLDVTTYRNGDPIPKVTDATSWAALTTGAYCYYNNDSATYASIYGKLYNWYAVNDPRGLAPVGWHVPTNVEWAILETCLDGSTLAGSKLKETGFTHWVSPNSGATNTNGFSGLPGGTRDNTGSFGGIGNNGYWWSSTPATTGAWQHGLIYNSGSISTNDNNREYGLSVRCIRD